MVFCVCLYGFRFAGCASESVSQSVSQPSSQSVSQSVSRAVSQSVGQPMPTERSGSQPVGRPAMSSGSGEAVSKSVRLPTEPSISLSVTTSNSRTMQRRRPGSSQKKILRVAGLTILRFRARCVTDIACGWSARVPVDSRECTCAGKSTGREAIQEDCEQGQGSGPTMRFV